MKWISKTNLKSVSEISKRSSIHSMVSQGMSFDGTMYELIVMQAERSLSFYWQNDDWRYAPQSPLNKWERVAAVADYVLSLAKKKE